MAMVRRSELVDALAAVAVSALSGPLGAIGVSAARELVKLLQNARGRKSEERELRKQVREAITAWAKGEHLDPDVVDRGLGWAIEYVQAAGCQHELIADADFDPMRAAEVVLTPAKARDEYWGTDPEYGVAERAVHITYNALCPKLKAEGGVVLAAIQASRHEIRGSIDQLREDLLGVADRHELIDYLEKQIRDWDYSPWTQGRKWTQDRRPSQLERTLEIADEQRTMSPTEALEGVWMLTVLGGPGSGKTWLARRLAREAAETALEQLRDPRVDPASVELPLFTTVAEWIKRHETGFEGLVEAALPHESQEKIRRLVLRPGARVLAVADSLDEGVAVNHARTLLNSLTSSPTRRLVVTSRPEAWHSAAAGLRATQDTRVGTLTELRYPKDVHGYVEAWFTEDPPTAQHLIRQLEERHELRATATSPLLLTFYCMLTEQEPDQELPRRRRELYRTIIDLLLAGGWATTEGHVDTDACRAILQQWAWDAVKEAVTPAGLGVWPETITTNRTPPDASAAMERALDNIAPKQEHPHSSFYDHEWVERRFLHRTLWEYLVSEHIATFSATKAAKALLPHIWFDPDWHITLPMAIAAHRRRSRLVDRLWDHHTDHPSPAQEVVNKRLEELLLEVAAQTDPEDWNKANRARICTLRESLIPHYLEVIVSSAHWGGLNHIEAILTALTHATSWRIPSLIGALSTLSPSNKEREEARRITLTHNDLWEFPSLASAFLQLKPKDEELTEARQTILATLPNAGSRALHDLIEALLKLGPSDEERTEARKAIIATIPQIPDRLSLLIDMLHTLNPSDEERTEARKAIVTTIPQIPNTAPNNIFSLIDALYTLDPSDKERAEARKAIVTTIPQIPNTAPNNIFSLIDALHTLELSDEERAEARKAIITAIPQIPEINPADLHYLVDELRTLVTTDKERVETCHTILTTLPNSDPWALHDLSKVLSTLEPSKEEQVEARQTILTTLPNAGPCALHDLIGALLKLGPSDEERTEARQTILTTLNSNSWMVDLVSVLLELEPSDEERAEARQTILTTLANANPRRVPTLVRALSTLEPSDEERAEARQIILTALPDANLIEVHFLMRELHTLVTTDNERTQTCRAMLATLPNVSPNGVLDLVRVLSELKPNDKERTKARHAISKTLSEANPRVMRNLVSFLRRISSVHDWLAALGIGDT